MLRQYAEFIAKVRELCKNYSDYARAVKEAANYCIANDILADFLKEQGGKVVSILTAEFDLDVAKKVWKEETLEDRNIEIVRNFLKIGLSREQISQGTGLSIDEILKIESEL